MTELICDICGTTYPETDEKCPTCGYSRGLTVFTPYDGQKHSVHEKIRGGRFSKKNVAKRMLERSEAEQEPAEEAAPEAPAETVKENEGVRAVQELTAQMSAAAAALNGQEVPAQTEKAAPEASAEPEPALDVPAEDVLPAEEIAAVVAASMPEEKVEIPAEEPAEAAEPEEQLPGEPVEMTAEEAEEEKQKAALAAYRRDVRMNLLLFFASVVFLVSSAYLVVTYGIPYLKNMSLPVSIVTGASTEAPTEAPTVAMTASLTLNYYDLTFHSANQGIQLEVAGCEAADLTWTSDDPAVATVSETGKVISVGNGTTEVHASYGDQTVSCTINCSFS